jgi:hypothetical protein
VDRGRGDSVHVSTIKPAAGSGRGADWNPKNRFEKLEYVAEPGDGTLEEDERPGVKTEFFEDGTRSIITKDDSPDVGFTYSVNPYRGVRAWVPVLFCAAYA